MWLLEGTVWRWMEVKSGLLGAGLVYAELLELAAFSVEPQRGLNVGNLPAWVGTPTWNLS